MRSNRMQVRLPLLATFGLLLILVVRVGLTGAATDTLGSSTSVAPQGKVHIVVRGETTGPAQPINGRFTISGAISDRGRFVDKASLDSPLTLRKLVGEKGAIWIRVGFLKPFPCQCNWKVVKGTKAYSGLRGSGQESGRYTMSTVNVTMSGTVSR